MTFAKEIAETRVINSFQSRSLERELELEQEQDQDKREERRIALSLYCFSLLLNTPSGPKKKHCSNCAGVPGESWKAFSPRQSK